MENSRATIVVPTACGADRRDVLLRAIGSLIGQEGGAPKVIIVVNGHRFDRDLLAKLYQHEQLVVHYLARGSVAAARRYGREAITTEFFGFLDDDDEYLPNAVATRLAGFETDNQADVVVTNGLYCGDQGERIYLPAFDLIQADPLGALMHMNWLASCGGLFRSATIGEDYFEATLDYFEWFAIAYRLALDRTLRFVDCVTYRVNETKGSASKSEAYLLAEPALLARTARLSSRTDIQREMRRKIGAALHGISDHYLGAGDRLEALKYHCRSLMVSGGWRYLPYTRRLLMPSRIEHSQR